jgi:hypothetical protein
MILLYQRDKQSQSGQTDIFLLEQKYTRMEYILAFAPPGCYDEEKGGIPYA